MNLKRTLTLITLVIVLVAGYFYYQTTRLLVGEELIVQSFTNNGTPTGSVLVQIPFLRDVSARQPITVSVDENGDGIFSQNEVWMENLMILTRGESYGGFYAARAPVSDGTFAQAVVEGKNYELRVKSQLIETETLLDFSTITDPQNATKGVGIEMAYAETAAPVEITNTDVPDITQRKGECAPTSAANNLIALVSRHGGEDLIPGDPQDFIENLKRHMNWTPENGVLPDDFVAGKNRWAAAAGVPIRTTKVGDT